MLMFSERYPGVSLAAQRPATIWHRSAMLPTQLYRGIAEK
jgi:hypothetical protein